MGGGGVGLQDPANVVARHLGHHHVKQDQVGFFVDCQFDGARAILGKQQPVLVLQDLAQ